MGTKKRSIIKLLTAMCMGIMILGLTAITGYAADYTSASTIRTDGTNTPINFTSSDKEIWYKFTLSSDGELAIAFTSYVAGGTCKLYTEDLTNNLTSMNAGGNASSSAMSTGTCILSSGNYYLQVKGTEAGKVILSLKFTSYGTNGTHADSYITAQTVKVGETIIGATTLTDMNDWYKVNISSSGTYLLKMQFDKNSVVELMDQTLASGYSAVYYGYYIVSVSKELSLNKGTYYLRVRPYEGFGTGSGTRYTGKYSWSLETAPCSHTYTSSSVNPTYFEQGYMLYTCSKCGDTYKDSYTSKKSLSLSSLTNQSGYVQLKWSKVSGATSYYVYRKTSSGSYKKIATVKSGSTVSYKDKTAKNGTTYTYKVVPYKNSTKGAGSGKKIVRLTAGSLTSAKNSSAGKLAVRWKKNAKATGYQVQWSRSSSFKSKTSKKVTGSSSKKYTISGLSKGKTYYVRVRPYKKVSGKTYYAAWSSSKKVKVKK